ncbi:MAG: hypothetical protein OIF47_08350 [Marinibacterium sp.]|nr:hypothetical protein [Marinibacterium sp.]
MAAGYSLKDQLFNADKVAGLGARFAAVAPGFDADRFQATVMARLPDLELKARITCIADALRAELPDDLAAAGPLLVAALPAPLDPTLSDNDFGDFIYAPLGEAAVALADDSPQPVLDVLRQITQRFSMEWALRPVLARWPDAVLETLTSWADDPNYHVRRLVSEGTRPRLPWGQGVGLAPAQTLPLLDRLHGDATRYVTRSVANHLNDIAKSDPDAVLERLSTWQTMTRQTPRELAWISSHALRSLVKSGHPQALQHLGFDPSAPIMLERLNIPARLAIGEVLPIEVTLSASAPCKAIVDYLFWRRKADGTLSPKVQKLKQITLGPEKPQVLTKAHRLKGDATTYRLHPGRHRIDIQVNGQVLGGADFDLTA